MEFLAEHRGGPPKPLPKTPYLARERYDGGPFLSYAVRKRKATAALDETPFDLVQWTRSNELNPTPVEEQASFLQTWLYFGLLSEMAGANAADEASFDPASTKAVDRVYEKVLKENGKYVKLDEETLQELLGPPQDTEERKRYLLHVKECVSYTQKMIWGAPNDLNHSVRSSICALGELFTTKIGFEFEVLKMPQFSADWSKGFLDDKAKTIMVKEQKWCPSDVERAVEKYNSVQTLHMCQTLDKSLPRRDHSYCTKLVCNLYQINNGAYIGQHQLAEGCSCEELRVSENELTNILFKDDKTYPLLRLKGGLQDLNYELVPYTSEAPLPYVAISHVWADGLGNPTGNALYRCKLHHLRSLVNNLQHQEPQNAAEPEEELLIWLDTLLSPALPGKGKDDAIKKIRHVYGNAKYVLVLDAGLMSYAVGGQDCPEALLRIFTSGWMRRLWTLQEGALSKSLLFQFADEPVAVATLVIRMFKIREKSMPLRAFFFDIYHEVMGLYTYFNIKPKPDFELILNSLDQALKHRSVSVPSDEALCIGTLLSLELEKIVAVTQEQGECDAEEIRFRDERLQERRMRVVWDQISIQRGGIPSSLIFLEDPKLSIPGYRWAPKSLLTRTGLLAANTRVVKWRDQHLGIITTNLGLRIQYPGYRLRAQPDYGDNKGPNPWPGCPRVPESYVLFRDIETRRWYRIWAGKYAVMTAEQKSEYSALGLFPLRDLLMKGRAVLIHPRDIGVKEAILATPVSAFLDENTGGGIPVKTEIHVFFIELEEEKGYIQDVIEKLARKMRSEEITDRHLELYNLLKGKEEEIPLQEVKEFKASVQSLKERSVKLLAEVVSEDERFVNAVRKHEGETFLTALWPAIRDWYNHDFVGEKIGNEQVWFVD